MEIKKIVKLQVTEGKLNVTEYADLNITEKMVIINDKTAEKKRFVIDRDFYKEVKNTVYVFNDDLEKGKDVLHKAFEGYVEEYENLAKAYRSNIETLI